MGVKYLLIIALVALGILGAIVAIISLSPFTAHTSYVNDGSLAGFYNFSTDGYDSNVLADSSSMSRNGTNSSGCLLYYDTLHGYYREFRGGSDAPEWAWGYPDNCILNESVAPGVDQGWTEFTYEVVFQVDNLTYRQPLIGSNDNYNGLCVATDGKPMLLVNTGAGCEIISNRTVNATGIFYVAATFSDTTNTGKIYLDGSLVATGSTSDDAWRWNPLNLGVYRNYTPSPHSDYLDGRIFMVRIYNRTLSESEIAQNYRNELWRIGGISANFTASVTSGSVPLAVQFQDNSRNANAWQWDFGDGTANSTRQNPVHTYTAAGTYTVSLTTIGPSGSTTMQRVAYITAMTVSVNNTFNPGAGPQHIVNLHGHTNKSDGVMDPEEYMVEHKDTGYTATAITDHWGVTNNPGVSGITFLPGTEWGTYSTPVPPQHGDVVLISTNFLNNGRPVARAYNASTNYYHYWSDVRGFAEKYDALLIYAHPDSGESWTVADLISIARDGDLVEVCNDFAVQNSTEVDAVLSAGIRLWLVTGEDIHGTFAGNDWIMVCSPATSNTSIIESIKEGNFYSCFAKYGNTPVQMIDDIQVDGNTILMDFPRSSSVTWIGYQGRVLKTSSGVTRDTYTVTGDEVYVRALVRQNNGYYYAWTQPMYIAVTG